MPTELPVLSNIEKTAEANTLWPPIADALGTFIRRRSAGADGYELTWRLIHVWEAAAAVLSGAVTTRVRTLATTTDAYLRCREHLHGRTWDPLSRTFNRSQGALDGSATRRLDLLWDVENFQPGGSRFLDATKTFLGSGDMNLRHLVSSWKQICDVPPEVLKGERFTVREAFRHVNSFRNRFAHVPFPYDEMSHLAETLADVTEQLFSIEPKPWQSFPDDRRESPLNGAIESRHRRLRGSMPPQLTSSDAPEPVFVFPAMPTKPAEYAERWDASPFVHVDSMFRPSVLTRLISEANGVWEFTRFLAERNSVIRAERPEYMAKLPAPAAVDYPLPAEEREEKATVAAAVAEVKDAAAETQVPVAEVEFEEALRHIANEEYEPAIEFFEGLVKKNPAYHIGWLRLGHALRELAMRRRFDNAEEATALFSRSIDALTRASEHSHVPRKAQALYERSKAYYHRGRQSGADGAADLSAAHADAEQAFDYMRDTRYETWIAFLHEHGVTSDATPAPG
jgi:hypothetical protein